MATSVGTIQGIKLPNSSFMGYRVIAACWCHLKTCVAVLSMKPTSACRWYPVFRYISTMIGGYYCVAND